MPSVFSETLLTSHSSNAFPTQTDVYHSRLFAAHWALFLPSLVNEQIGSRIHTDGSPATGFEVLFESEYDLRDCTQSYKMVELGVVEEEDLVRVANSTQAPAKSLVSAFGRAPKRRIEVKNCQTWLREVVTNLAEEGLVEVEATRQVENAPKN
ncbi:hypothetical protein K504DRAFT_440340 [Pleomassaria siparia CBS 279.74]|uniref:Uncharacterized protein n=1 Tax=Pleomassaria siparia CBS 279.74 TaxID=1314801 RepID=A0A6G1JXD3_9PLEO|nr:hypothetical protein K504DRAFT_440340 [Pleomassaria siparia CBS 279.74]